MLYNIHNQLKIKKPCQNIGMRGCRLCPIKGFPPFPKVDNVLFCFFIRVKEGINLKSEMFISFINNHSTCCCCFSRLFGIFMDNDFEPSPLSLSIRKAKKKVSLGLWPNFCLFVAFQAIAFHDRLQSSRVP